MSDAKLMEAIASAMKKRGHADFDRYIGLEHRPVSVERYGTSSAYQATCTCGAKLTIEVRL